MTKQQAAAYVFSQAVSALFDLEGMKAENASRADKGLAQAYDEAAFVNTKNTYSVLFDNNACYLFASSDD